jgi:hypothetical protein
MYNSGGMATLVVGVNVEGEGLCQMWRLVGSTQRVWRGVDRECKQSNRGQGCIACVHEQLGSGSPAQVWLGLAC